MNSKLRFETRRALNIVSVIAIAFLLFVFFKHNFSSVILLHTQAPNYGDIKMEILDGNNVIETRNILINPKHRFYFQKVAQLPDNAQIRFYFDRRHRLFVTKGVLVIGKSFKLDWISPAELSDDASHYQVNKYNSTRFTSLFEGFGESAYFKIDIKDGFSRLPIAGLLPSLLISLICAMVILLAGQFITNAFSRVELLNSHKLKFLVAAFLIILFLTTSPLKNLLLICLVFWTGYYLISHQAARLQKPESLLTGLFLLIVIGGFGAQADLLKILKNEVKNSDADIEFDFFKNFGERFARYFNYKNEIGHINSQLKVDVFERSPTPKVIVGKHGTMFEGTGERRIEGDNIDFFDNISDYLGRLPFGQGELDQWYRAISQRNCWLKERGIDYVFAIAPTKAMVYPELLPEVISELKSSDNKPRIELLDDRLKQNRNLAYINLTGPLVDAKNLHQDLKIFYRTDFHWNYLGTYYAYKAIMEKLSESSGLQISPIPLNDFNLDVNPNWAHQNFLGLLGLLPKWYNNEHYIKLMPKTGNPIKNLDPYGSEGVHDIRMPRLTITAKSGVEYLLEHIENKNAQDRTILVIGDSFIQKALPLISAHASQNYFSRAIFGFPNEIVETLKPDIVIQEILNMYLLRLPPVNPPAIMKSHCD